VHPKGKPRRANQARRTTGEHQHGHAPAHHQRGACAAASR
jgi:hypothetical protein